jgi:hypothetical protein
MFIAIQSSGAWSAFLPLVVIVFMVISFVRALTRAQQAKERHEDSGAETDEERRAREIRERIRRAVAERRAGSPVRPEAPPPLVMRQSPPVRRTAVPPLEPFGGPMRRTWEQLERKLAPRVPDIVPTASAELERQEQATKAIRSLEVAQLTLDRRNLRAADAAQAVAEAEPALRTKAREQLLEDLRDPASLRRAFVLREVLGAPVGLR